MTESRNIFDLLAKIEWEGGITGILDYGERDIEEYDVPDDLKDAWADMADRYNDFEAEMSSVYALLEQYESKYNEDRRF